MENHLVKSAAAKKDPGPDDSGIELNPEHVNTYLVTMDGSVLLYADGAYFNKETRLGKNAQIWYLAAPRLEYDDEGFNALAMVSFHYLIGLLIAGTTAIKNLKLVDFVWWLEMLTRTSFPTTRSGPAIEHADRIAYLRAQSGSSLRYILRS